MSGYFHRSPDGQVRPCSTTPDKCKYGRFHSVSKEDVEVYSDRLNESRITMENKMRSEWNKANCTEDQILPFKRYVALKYNNDNILLSQSSLQGFLSHYNKNKELFLDKKEQVRQELIQEGRGHRNFDWTMEEVCEKLAKDEGYYDFHTYKSGHIGADQFARDPGVNFGYAGKEFHGLHSLYSGTSFSYGDACKVKDRISTRGVNPLIEKYNTELDKRNSGIKIDRMFTVDGSADLLLVKVNYNEQRKNGKLMYDGTENFIFLTTREQLDNDIFTL